EPALEYLFINLSGLSVEMRGIFKFAGTCFQFFFLKIGTAPEHQPDTVLQLAVAHDRIPFQKPHRMGVPNLTFSFWKMPVDLFTQKVADFSMCFVLEGVRGLEGGVHGVWVYTLIERNHLRPKMSRNRCGL